MKKVQIIGDLQKNIHGTWTRIGNRLHATSIETALAVTWYPIKLETLRVELNAWSSLLRGGTKLDGVSYEVDGWQDTIVML